MAHTTTLDLFESSLQATDKWLIDLMHELGWADRHRAYAGLRATLHALRDQVMVDECAQFSAQLPLLLRGVFWEGWNPRHRSWQTPTPDDFVTTIHSAFQHAPDVDPERVARAVFKVMAEHISAGEMKDVRGVVPKHIRRLFPELAPASP